jgi:formamidopyrimidine-DNA glycosylase
MWMPKPSGVKIFGQLVHDHYRARRIGAFSINNAGILQRISAEALAPLLEGEWLVSSRRYGKHLFILLHGAGVLAMHFGTNDSLGLGAGGEDVPAYAAACSPFRA